MRSLRTIGLLFSCVTTSVFSIDYTDSTLPSTITLNGGQRQDTITSTQSPQGWQATTIGYNRNLHLSISGSAGSQYALQVRDDTTTFFLSGVSVSSGISATLTSAHTLAIQGGSVNVGSGASFSVISSGNTINAQGSEYGGESKVRFSRNSSLSLAQNASANFSNAKFFIHDGSTLLAQGANLTVSASTIRFQNTLTNNGGSANLTGNVYNVGGTVGVRNDNTTANFTINDGGSVVVNGNFYNGVESNNMSVDNTGGGLLNAFDPAFGGGGNLIINGGNMRVTGSLISQQGGTSINGGGISNPQNSSISIYGGTLQVGTLQNLAGSTVTFGIKNGVMGKLTGSLTNNGGDVVVDFTGASDGQTYQFITGSISGANILYRNADLATITTNGGSATYNLDSTKINAFVAGLVGNERAIFEANKAIIGDAIYSSGSSTQLKTYMQDTNQSINDIINAPFGAFVSLKSTQANFLDSKENLSVGLIGLGLLAGNLGKNSGTLFGLQARYVTSAMTLSAAYGKASLEHSNTAQSITHTSHNILLNAKTELPISANTKLALKAQYFTSIGNFNRNNTLLSTKTNASQELRIVEIDSEIFRVIQIQERIEITPYGGARHYIYALGKSKEDNLNALEIQEDNFYVLGLGFGIAGKYAFNNYTLFGKLDYEIIATESRDIKVVYGTQNLTYALPLHNTLNVALGGSFALRSNTFVDVSGFFVNYSIANTIGLNASLKMEF